MKYIQFIGHRLVGKQVCFIPSICNGAGLLQSRRSGTFSWEPLRLTAVRKQERVNLMMGRRKDRVGRRGADPCDVSGTDRKVPEYMQD